MNRHNIEDWLVEFDTPGLGAQPDPSGSQAPTSDPNQGVGNPSNPNVANMMPQNAPAAHTPEVPQDISNDPQSPDMPEEKPEVNDFEVWKNTFLKESIKGDVNQLITILNQVRDKDDLDPYQRKFVEDNFNIQLIRQHSNVNKASKEIRRQIQSQLDRNNPATSVVNHMISVLETDPTLNNTFIKLNGYAGLKGDLHRKFVAALTGSVQVGSGANTEDIVFNEREYSIQISTRFNSKWGDVYLGQWSLKEDDPERFLSEPELKRLQEGSPDEREVLRRRVVVESISELFETRAFIINVVGDNGTIYTLGWDVATSLRGAYTEGKIKVKTRKSDNSEAMISDDGNITPLLDLSVYYVRETGELDADGKSQKELVPFMERKEGMLFLSASLQLIKEAATALQGAAFKETPYRGNPSDLKTLTRCVYSAHDLLMRQC